MGGAARHAQPQGSRGLERENRSRGVAPQEARDGESEGPGRRRGTRGDPLSPGMKRLSGAAEDDAEVVGGHSNDALAGEASLVRDGGDVGQVAHAPARITS